MMEKKTWLSYIPSQHEQKIVEFFGEENTKYDLNKFKQTNKKILFVCFTNRSGSNIVCEHLGAGKSFNIGGENLNFDAVIDNSKKHNFISFSEYFNWLMNINNSNQENFVLKCSWEQLYFLEKYGYINNDFKGFNYLLIKRLDVLSQAVSYSIALQRGSWTSQQQDSSSNVEYKENIILSFLKGVSQSYANFDYYFSVKNINKIDVIYEDYCFDPVKTIEGILSRLGLSENIENYKIELKLKKQANKLKLSMKEKFQKNFSL